MHPFTTMSVAPLGVRPAAISRPQVGIERLPTRRLSNEPRESMNCKSCRKRKIKCNRLRPACEACQVFQCACIYDAVPKKRGPKTDVLEALLKRVDGLEARLKERKSPDGSPSNEEAADVPMEDGNSADTLPTVAEDAEMKQTKPPRIDTNVGTQPAPVSSAVKSAINASEHFPVQPDQLLQTYFTRFHAKPFHILDQHSVRQRIQCGQLPAHLSHAIYAVAARHTTHPGGYQSALRLSEEFALRSRSEVDMDDPCVDAVQTLLLLVLAFTAAGRGKKAYMLMANAVGMAVALELHREVDTQARITPVEREMRRRLFWTVYFLDRFMACGSRRPTLIGDKMVLLRLPSWSPAGAGSPVDGEFFRDGSNLQFLQGVSRRFQGSTGMLIDITRILGNTHSYLAAGGVKGDSHFPWHSLSSLTKIKQDLDVWASGTDDVFSSIDTLFGQHDSTVLVLSKLIYHLIHCLIYRPFLPIDLVELSGSSQQQMEATNMCFLHANAIAELVELGKQAAAIEWPAFVGYCICTAGTVHVHGAYYNKNNAFGDPSVFAASPDFLSREMQQLSELRYAWASVQLQREALQGIYNAHAALVRAKSENPMRFGPMFHLESFFDRYANIGMPEDHKHSLDVANLGLSDVIVDFATDTYTGHNLYAPRPNGRHDLLMDRDAGKAHDGHSPASLRCSPKDVDSVESFPLLSADADHPSHKSSAYIPATGGIIQPGAGYPAIVSGHGYPKHHHSGADPAFGPGPGHGNQQLPSTPISPLSAHDRHLTPASVPPTSNTSRFNGYDPMFGSLPTNAFSSPAPWHGDEEGMQSHGIATHSNTGEADDKDPFLSLLEQLADNEHALGDNTELDAFLGAAQN